MYNSSVSTAKTEYDPGVICGIYKDHFDVSCLNKTVISILELQLPGKTRIQARDFVNGSGKKILSIGKKIGE